MCFCICLCVPCAFAFNVINVALHGCLRSMCFCFACISVFDQHDEIHFFSVSVLPQLDGVEDDSDDDEEWIDVPSTRKSNMTWFMTYYAKRHGYLQPYRMRSAMC